MTHKHDFDRLLEKCYFCGLSREEAENSLDRSCDRKSNIPFREILFVDRGIRWERRLVAHK